MRSKLRPTICSWVCPSARVCQTQNMLRTTWTREEVDLELRRIMKHIHEQCVTMGQPRDASAPVDYARGANVAGFRKVADAMLAYGLV